VACQSDPAEKSILRKQPITDGGISDLCSLLTFLSGRCVTTADRCEQFTPKKVSALNASYPSEILKAASILWKHRNAIQEEKLTAAFSLHVHSIRSDDLLYKSYLGITSLNIITDWFGGAKTLSKTQKDEVKKKVSEAIGGVSSLQDDERNALRSLLNAKIDGGLGTEIQRLSSLLVNYGILHNSDLMDDRIKKRITAINVLRNAIIHRHKFADLGFQWLTNSEEVSEQYRVLIFGGVIPAITQLVLGQLGGLTVDNAGGPSQDLSQLKNFFTKGTWGTWKFEQESFDKYWQGIA
jgi:hypothetical protein